MPEKKKSSKKIPPRRIYGREILDSKDSFYTRVYEVVRLIPPGRATSYGAIANYLGTGLSARMVGYAMNASHNYFPPVPAHRVVNRNGMLTGKHHFPSANLMEQMLQNEGIKIKNDTILNFEKVFWDPNIELL